MKNEETSRRVLVVDDEPSITSTIKGVLEDEGFEVSVAGTGVEALSLLQNVKPDLILLDVWLPQADGIEVLKEIKQLDPGVAVIMMSGHASISTAVQATRLGAEDFIEKPLAIDSLLQKIERVLDGALSVPQVGVAEDVDREQVSIDTRILQLKADSSRLIRKVFDNQNLLSGRRFQQATLKRSAVLYGQGLHSGTKSGLVLEPLPSNSGIHFVSLSGDDAVPAYLDYVESTGFATSLKLGNTQVSTVEHLLSALHAYGISNLLVKCNREVPVMDGSALEFCNLIDETGIELQDGDWFALAPREPLRFGDDKEFILLEPHDSFEVHYTLKYPKPLGEQQLSFSLGDRDTYKREIAPARTFGFVKDVGMLQSKGLALGGRFDNFVLYGEEGAINGDLRFQNEAVRHKILDLIGDLFLLGRPIDAKITACMTGHSDNIGVLAELQQHMLKAVSSYQNAVSS